MVRCLPEALGSILGAMEERGFSVYISYLVIDNEMYVMVKGILTQIITWGSTGEKLYARPSSLTASRKALLEATADEAAQTAGCKIQYSGKVNLNISTEIHKWICWVEAGIEQ